MRKLPNVFIVGAAKCGTTSLHFWLSQHPEIFMSHPKELRYWCFDLHAEADRFHFGLLPAAVPKTFRPFLRTRRWIAQRWSRSYSGFPIRTLEDYLNAFDGCESYEYAGESSPDYLLSNCAAREIRNFNPEAYILIVIRDPAEFVASLYFELYSGRRGETLKTLSEALQLEEFRRRGVKVPFRARFPTTLYYRENARFSEQISRYLEQFPESQVRIFILDDLKCDPNRVYASILEFLDVNDKDYTPVFTPKNVSKKTLGRDLSAEDLKTLDFLREDLRSEVLTLSELLDRDLTRIWGY